MKKLFYITILIVFIISSSCQKFSVEKNIIGSWKYVFLSKDDLHKEVIWNFEKNNELIIIDKTNPDSLIIDNAIYSLDVNYLGKTKVSVYEYKTKYWVEGTYQILKSSKNILVLERIVWPDGKTSGAHLRKEFIKVKE